MTRPLTFKAQALDNTSPDHYQIGDKVLAPEDQASRRQITEEISGLARNGTLRLQVGGAELIVKNRNLGPKYFLAQVYSKELDHAGRRAPIVCCGEFSRRNDPQAVIQAIQGFAKNIGRTIEPAHLKAIGDGLTGLKKRADQLTLAVIVIAILLATLTTFVVNRERSMRTKMQGTPVQSIPMSKQ